MKYRVALLMALALSFNVKSECQLMASQQTVSYGTLSAAERQAAKEQDVELPERHLQLTVNCDKSQRVRLFFSSSLPKNNAFAFGSEGRMKVTAMNAVVDDREVLLTPVRLPESAITNAGNNRMAVTLDEGAAFVAGDEVSGQHFSLTLAVSSYFKNQPVTEKMTYRGNLQIRVDAQ